MYDERSLLCPEDALFCDALGVVVKGEAVVGAWVGLCPGVFLQSTQGFGGGRARCDIGVFSDDFRDFLAENKFLTF